MMSLYKRYDARIYCFGNRPVTVQSGLNPGIATGENTFSFGNSLPFYSIMIEPLCNKMFHDDGRRDYQPMNDFSLYHENHDPQISDYKRKPSALSNMSYLSYGTCVTSNKGYVIKRKIVRKRIGVI